MICKFDDSFNVEAVYELLSRDPNVAITKSTTFNCSCPAGPRPSCKHRKMIPIMFDKADTEAFYEYETQRWHFPLADKPEIITKDVPTEAMLGLSREAINELDTELHAEQKAWAEDESDAEANVEVEPLRKEPDVALCEPKTELQTTFEQDKVTGRTSRNDEDADLACAPNRVEPTAPPSFKRRV